MSRGEYLARAADCIACHTARGGKPYAGGRAFHLPFGTIYATNLTPDEETGLGKWSDEAFIRAVRQGVGSQGHLYPAMPYTSYAAMSRDDVLAIKKYLSTLEPVKQAPPATTLSFPFNQRWGMEAWNLVFFREKRFVTNESEGTLWNRGAYLATALGHCGECHTPRNAGFAMKSKDYLSGAEIEGWKAYNTTQDQAYGIGAWSDEQLRGYLSTGHAPGRSSAAGPMAEVVEHSLQYMTPSDINSLVAYMRQVAPATGERQETVNLQPVGATASNAVLPAASQRVENLRGKQLFAADCAGCHQWNGAGRQSQYASLVGSRAVNDPTGTALTQVILKGTSIRIGGQVHQMPGFGSAYSDADVAAVANYVVEHFGDKEGSVTAEAVRSKRATP
ncbi:cytochrome c [Herbaspirillum chlorophenolicum]|uniref:cytochrome c n=1 Tax=Herbaspirillum chlorophenolicum TaxID=211589 RepID=UPI001E60AF45|nr:cytochrome c [Herbaspirillum chlorophenolicum]